MAHTPRKRTKHSCIECGKERWVRADSYRERCMSCAAKLRRLKGFPVSNGYGYLMVMLYPDSPFYKMANKRGYVMEHRLVMAQHLERCLFPWEVVHHIYQNGARTNKAVQADNETKRKDSTVRKGENKCPHIATTTN